MKSVNRTMELYKNDKQDSKIASVAAEVEGMGYENKESTALFKPRFTRVEETITFARLMGYKKIGIATCIGLLNETHYLEDIFNRQGFQANSICCKVGKVDKSELGISEEDKVRPNTFEAICNPIAQAKVFNELKTDLNIIVGLCVGHDILFY